MRLRIALVVIALVAPITLAALHLANVRGEQEQRFVGEHALVAARATAAHYADLIALGRTQMEKLVPLVERLDCDHAMAQALYFAPMFLAIAVADVEGNILCAARPVPSGVNIADREYLQHTFRERRFNVSEVLLGRTTGEWTVVFGHPSNDAAKALFAAINLSWLQAALDNVSLPAGSIVSVADKSGRIMARAPYDASVIGREVSGSAAFRAAIGTQKEGVLETVNFAGVPSIVSYARVPDEDIFVRVLVPKTIVSVARNQVLYESLGAALVGCALALLIGWLSLRQLIGDPIRRLTDAAARLGGGDLSARTGVHHADTLIGGLAQKLDELAAHGARVTRALRTLSAGNRTVLRERNERELLQAMCRVAVERGGYAAAYVCYPRQDEAKSIEVAACEGADDGFISTVTLTWADAPHGQGSVGRCIRTGERSIIRAIGKDALAAPWHAAARARGFGCVISLPLRVQSALVGTFTLIAREEDAFDKDEVELLDEMAADLSFGMEVLRSDARRREAEAIARRALTHDPVIDVPNRAWFVRRLIECLERGTRNHEPVAVLDVHFGRLQEIVDSFGHEHGNEVLRQAAARLKQLPEADENFGRLPVDDFGIVLCSYDAEAAQRTARAVLDLFKAPVKVGQALVDVQPSVGISMFPGHGAEPEVLVRRASLSARDAFRRQLPYVIYSGAMARENPGRVSLATELRAAIEARELCLHFQPKVSLADAQVVGCEALVRWRHPVRGMVPPLEFIGVAEEIGLIRPMTYQIIDLAVRQLHSWLPAGIRVPISVNLSPRNLYDPDFLAAIDGIFDTWNVPRDLLHFEITEGALVDDPAAAKKILERLAAHGAKVYIDDFGTGYSSLSYLVSLPVHALKIDRSFITQMGKSAPARSLVASIVSMSHQLGLKVVAEGVETASEVETLKSFGCDNGQGYYFAKPVAAAEFAAWLSSRT